jgi:glyoxylase-like metal-dependent hydrolase (beta-lactamase superfamily II)
MWIKEPGWITDTILFLGREESCVYLIKGDEYTIIGGGMAHIIPDVLEQLKRFDIEESKITRLLILHTHFDHVGIVSFFQRRWPHLRVVSSARGKSLLEEERVKETIRNMSRGLVSMHGMDKALEEIGVGFDDIVVDETVTGGDRVVWGGVEIEIIDAPGHSSCSIGAYLPAEKALFASDAGGIPYGGRVFASGNSNFTQFQESLERFATYDVEIHLAEHYGAFTGEDGRKFMARSIESAKETRALLESSYRKTGDIEASTAEITDVFMDAAAGYFLPRPVMEMVVRQMMKHIAKTVDGG